MIHKLITSFLLVVTALGCWLAYYYSDKKVIERQFDGLAVELGKEGQETALQTALKIREITKMLAESCVVRIPERSYEETLEQDLIIRYLIYHRNRYAVITVAFEDLLIDIPASGEAMVQSTVRLKRKKANMTEAFEELSRVELALEKVNQKWLIQEVMLPEALME